MQERTVECLSFHLDAKGFLKLAAAKFFHLVSITIFSAANTFVGLLQNKHFRRADRKSVV